jgi:hypothetical protein
MKKYALFLAVISCACISFAQVLKINQMELNDNYERVFVKEIHRGDVIDLDTKGSLIVFDADIINTSDAEHAVGLELEVAADYTDGIDISGCWDECLAPWNFRFGEVTIGAEGSSQFSVDYYTNDIEDSQALITCTFLVDGGADFVFYVRFGDAPQAINAPVISTNKAYPNPATSVVNIDYAVNRGNVQIALYNILGVPVYEQPVKGKEGTAKINVSNFAPGIYFYIIKVDGKSVETKKLIISR